MKKNSYIAIVSGVPGVGKTSVINKALELALQDDLKVTSIVFGTEMMNIAINKYHAKQRDELRKLPPNVQKDIQKKAAQHIRKQSRGKIVIVDTHFSIKIGLESFLPGIPKWVSDILKAKILVIIETIPEEIVSRRTFDNSRNRDDDTVEIITEHQIINKAIASSISQQTGALLQIIQNSHSKSDIASKELYNCLKQLVT